MRSRTIIAGVAVVACVISYLLGHFFGYEAGTKKSPYKEDKQGLMVYVLALDKMGERAEWERVKNGLDLQILGLTREYERQFGAPSPTDPFAKDFARAQVIAKEMEGKLVPVSSIKTNSWASPDLKVTFERSN